MGNLVTHSADEPDNRRAPTSTAELPTERDNDAALALGARPNQQHEPEARHNGAKRGATANTDGAKHILKPPKYDGTGSFETFLAQFQNCDSYNKWTKREQLVYLQNSLEKSAEQVLRDYSAETTGSLSKMIKVLKKRFGEANQSDKYRLEPKSPRSRPNKTRRNLHSVIQQLAVLALPELEYGARETMACDYFVDAPDDPNFALKSSRALPERP